MAHLIHADGLVKATVMIICLAVLVQSATFIGKFGKKRFKNVPISLAWWDDGGLSVQIYKSCKWLGNKYR